jgi:signal transduction histidine kinase
MVLSEQPCDAAEIIEAVCRDCQARAVTRGITLVARIADGITCRADIHRLRQALAGIVDNAIAFSPGDGIVNVNMLRGTDGGLAISVTDAGPGIADAEAARAFEPFRQVKEGAARPHEGLGLGLYIARGILRLHGGDVSISSSAESGTDVRIHLPAARVQWTSSAAETETVTVAHVA